MSSWNVHAIHSLQCLSEQGMNTLTQILTQDADTGQIIVMASENTSGGLKDLVALAASHDSRVWGDMEKLAQAYRQLAEKLLPGQAGRDLTRMLKAGFTQLETVLKSLWLVGEAGISTWAYVDRIQNRWIAELAAQKLAGVGLKPVIADCQDLMVYEERTSGYVVSRTKTMERLSQHLPEADAGVLFIISGGYGTDVQGQPCSPGSHRGEMAGTAAASLLHAASVTLWNPDSFVMTADPVEVPSAHIIDKLSYEEATELAYFGGKILHPQVMVPIIAQSIPLHLRCFAEPEKAGTLVCRHCKSDYDHPVKGFSVIHDVSLINIEGAGMVGIPGISSRLFSSLRERGISVIFISQASSEHSICFAVPQPQAALAESTARTAFSEELASERIHSVLMENGCAILAAVGEDMPGTPGIAASFFGALGKAGINVRAIAQGSSERNISAVIRGGDSKRALRALHAGFFLSNQAISIGLIGPGLIGSTLLSQIQRETERLKQEFGVDLRVRGIANSTAMLLQDDGIALGSWREQLASRGKPIDLDVFTKFTAADYFPHWVIIDCSTSEDVPERYVQWIEQGIHIITPNKKAGTSRRSYYEKLMSEGRKRGKHFLYETTVGAGLPVIGTLKDLIQTGDRIRMIEGVFSGTLAYLFWKYDGSVPFSVLVKDAKELGYTEPDPRDDLSGMDIVRKTVILAREIGMHVNIEDVPVKSLVPDALKDVSLEEFMDQLHTIDNDMLELFSEARERKTLLKYVGVVDPEGSCKVELREYPIGHAFARITGTDNIVAFTTDRYHEQPLVIQGPGAGPDVTAGGVFADLLRLAAYLGARF